MCVTTAARDWDFDCPPGGPSPSCSRSRGPLQQHSPERGRGWSPHEGSGGPAPVEAQTRRDAPAAVVPGPRRARLEKPACSPRRRQGRPLPWQLCLLHPQPAPPRRRQGALQGLCPVCAAVDAARGAVSSVGRPSVLPRGCRPLLEDIPRLPLVLCML